jgi:hypothetical protein
VAAAVGTAVMEVLEDIWSRGVLGAVEALERVENLGFLTVLSLILVQHAVGSSRASAGFRCRGELFFGSESIEFALVLYTNLLALKVLMAWRMQCKSYDD